VVGHSAGAHLALWAAAQSRLPSSSVLHRDAPLPVLGAVALGGPGDLRDFETYGREICGPALERLIGGAPDAVPERWAHASPSELLPLGVRQVLIVGESDPVMPLRAREAYAAKARAAGDRVDLVVVPGAHFEVIAPTTEAFAIAKDQTLGLQRPASRSARSGRRRPAASPR
jgi:acetyl esterase/lipase